MGLWPLDDLAVNVAASLLMSSASSLRRLFASDSEKAGKDEIRREHAAFCGARKLLKANRKSLAVIAAELPGYRDARHLGDGIPLLCHESWIPTRPIPLPPPPHDDSSTFSTILRPDAVGGFGADDVATVLSAARAIMPVRDDGTHVRLADYVEAIEAIPGERPQAWEDRTCYRLRRIVSSALTHRLEFGLSSYFSYQRTGEVLCYELARELWDHDDIGALGGPNRDAALRSLEKRLSVRASTGNWMDFDGRCANAGVNNITILRLDDGYRFLMMSRGMGFTQPGGSGAIDADSEHGAVASAMGATHVIPAGEFQPSSMSAVRDQSDCTIWSTLMREFAEEILLCPEAKSQGVTVFDFERVAPFSLMIAAARGVNPRWRSWYLGTALDPLSLKPEIMTATVLDVGELGRMFEVMNRLGAYRHDVAAQAQVDGIVGRFPAVPSHNHEGRIIAHNRGGEDLSPENLSAFINHKQTLPAAAGCLHLVRRHLGDLK